MTSLKLTAKALAISTLIITQSGCIGGIAASSATGNYWWAAGGIALGTATLYNSSSERFNERYKASNDYNWGHGKSWGYMRQRKGAEVVIGVLLSSVNSDHSETLNPFPVTEAVATKYNVQIADLETYNEELPEVIRTDKMIQADIKGLVLNKFTQIEKDQFARDLGLTDAKDLNTIVASKEVPQKLIEQIADHQNLSLSTAVIYINSTLSQMRK